jgi:serine/threonine-protein kinase RsbW
MRRASHLSVEVLSCSSALNADEMVSIKNRMNRLISRNQKNVVLDMSQTSSIDLVSLGILVERLRTLRSLNGDIKFCNIRPEVDEVLQLVGLNGLMESYGSREEALASF